jgi:hypothetical protein
MRFSRLAETTGFIDHTWKDGRVVDCAGLLNQSTCKAYRGSESPSFRQLGSSGSIPDRATDYIPGMDKQRGRSNAALAHLMLL